MCCWWRVVYYQELQTYTSIHYSGEKGFLCWMFQLSSQSRGNSDDLCFMILDLLPSPPCFSSAVSYPCYTSISSFVLKPVLDLWKWTCIALLGSACPFEWSRWFKMEFTSAEARVIRPALANNDYIDWSWVWTKYIKVLFWQKSPVTCFELFCRFFSVSGE